MTTPFASVVLVTRNGMATLPSVLDAIARQRVDWPYEIVAVDSSSSDGTADLLRRRADRVLSIDAGAFNHGVTRNMAIEQASGELIVLLVQDAVPASDTWLAALTAPLLAEDTLAGTFARQLPHPGASAITREYLSRWAATSCTAHVAAIGGRAEFDALDPSSRFHRCVFDNVCSCIRRSIWTRFPFSETPIAEDIEWARDVLLAGHTLAYVPDAAVLHSHERGARDEFTRTRLLHSRLHDLFGLRTIPTVPALVRAIGSSLVLHVRLQGARRRPLGLAVAWPLGQYLGAQASVKRRVADSRPL